MAKTRKQLTMSLTVSVPSWMTAAQARREVRTLVNEQSNYLDHGPDFQEVHGGTVKVRELKPAART